MKSDNPLLDDLGIRRVDHQAGRCTFEMDVQARHLNRQGSLQGGVTATLLDAACGYAGMEPDGDDVVGHSVTVMLNISYLARTSAGRLRATGSVTKAGRSLYFSTATLTGDAGEIIATAQGTFKRSLRPEKA